MSFRNECAVDTLIITCNRYFDSLTSDLYENQNFKIRKRNHTGKKYFNLKDLRDITYKLESIALGN